MSYGLGWLHVDGVVYQRGDDALARFYLPRTITYCYPSDVTVSPVTVHRQDKATIPSRRSCATPDVSRFSFRKPFSSLVEFRFPVLSIANQLCRNIADIAIYANLPLPLNFALGYRLPQLVRLLLIDRFLVCVSPTNSSANFGSKFLSQFFSNNKISRTKNTKKLKLNM